MGNFLSTVRDDDSDYNDGQIPDDSQINSPTSSRRSPLHESYNDNINVDDAQALCMSFAVVCDSSCFAFFFEFTSFLL